MAKEPTRTSRCLSGADEPDVCDDRREQAMSEETIGPMTVYDIPPSGPRCCKDCVHFTSHSQGCRVKRQVIGYDRVTGEECATGEVPARQRRHDSADECGPRGQLFERKRAPNPPTQIGSGVPPKEFR